MAMINFKSAFAFSAFWTSSRAGPGPGLTKRGQIFYSALLFCHQVGARVARQQCSTLQPGTSDSTPVLSSRTGHLYFGENRTFLLWVDRPLNDLSYW